MLRWGPCKVWARLRVRDGIRVSRKRLLRVMREHALLSPHRTRPCQKDRHDRQIITPAPNIMWAIDATQITTVQDGKVWLFGVAEHWNAELLGWHVTKHGTRFEATQALAMALRQQFGHLSAGAARGLALRHDHAGVPTPLAAWGGGSAFMAEHVQNQIRFWGISPSYAFVAEPETNGVIERLFRTLKEQIIHGRVFRTIDELREAVRDVVARYNAEWLIEKNGYRSPLDARAAHLDTNLRRPASCNRVSREPGAVQRALVGDLVPAATGRTDLFVSGGAEHQGPDGGGPVGVIARRDVPARIV
jgi:transposase InsO family protein